MHLKDIIHNLVLSKVYHFIDISIYDGELEANFVINFNVFPKYYFNEVGEFDGSELKSIWDKQHTINSLEEAGYSVNIKDINYSNILVQIKY